MAKSEPAFVYHAIIPHPTEPQVLLLPGEDRWALPRCEISWLPNWQDVRSLNQYLMETLHLDVTVLRCLCHEHDAQGDRGRAVYVLECQTPSKTAPAGGCWVSQDGLQEIPLAPPEHRALIETHLAEVVAEELPPLRRPWARSGWFAAAQSWILDQLQRLDVAAKGPVEQYRTWARSCILRVPTESGTLYFKAVPPRGAPAPQLLSLLSARYPRHFPRLLAVDTARNWVLMHDLGGQSFCDVPEIARWEEALSRFAQLQIDLAGDVDDLLRMGCPAQRLDTLDTGIDSLLADAEALLVGKPSGLTAEEIEALRALTPRSRELCARLAAYRLPQTLEHADLWAGNIVLNDDNLIFFDWAESSVSHPFFSFLLFMPDATHRLSHVPDARRRLRDAYLEPWTVYQSMDRLSEAFELAQPLAALHHALLQHRVVLPNLESSSRWELHAEIPWDLKYILRHREKL